MNVNGKNLRPIWKDLNTSKIRVIDQRLLPHEFKTMDLNTVDDVVFAIREMVVRGAPLIGVTAAFGVYLALANTPQTIIDDDDDDDDDALVAQCLKIKAARPTAVNLAWAVDRVLAAVLTVGKKDEKIRVAFEQAKKIEEEEVDNCRQIGVHGLPVIEHVSKNKKKATVNILTHCNAGWLACIEYGTATAPIYAAFDQGIDVHVWVDETRPLNQGARLTAWELGKHGVKHTVICDNAGGHLMQHGMVDLVIVGTDRTTHTGDVANKIGTYLKALAARDNHVPFYVALPSSTFDWNLTDGIRQIQIEERNPDEVKTVRGMENGKILDVLIMPKDSPAANFAFDVTPARLITGFITERGICKPNKADIYRLFPEKAK